MDEEVDKLKVWIHTENGQRDFKEVNLKKEDIALQWEMDIEDNSKKSFAISVYSSRNKVIVAVKLLPCFKKSNMIVLMRPNSSVCDLKEEISSEYNALHMGMFCLYYDGMELEDNEALWNYGFVETGGKQIYEVEVKLPRNRGG